MADSESRDARIPVQTVGPVSITGPEVDDELMVPLATLETPLWPSTARGARVSMACGGIRVVVVDDRMTRSLLFQAGSGEDAVNASSALLARRDEIEAVIAETTRFGRLLDLHVQLAGNLLYLRIEMQTGDAAGHNMVTWAADRTARWITAEFPSLSFVSISGNTCTDKKVSAINGLLGRGKSVIADIEIPADVCSRLLKTTPQKIADLNVKKNLVGSTLAGSLRSANAHFANLLLGFYLATGQDAANIVEGSQGMTLAEVRGEALYFSVSLPSIIVGTVGIGKDLPYVVENLEDLDCLTERPPGANARRLAAICAATVLCGELSLMAAQTNPGELMRVHRSMERKAR